MQASVGPFVVAVFSLNPDLHRHKSPTHSLLSPEHVAASHPIKKEGIVLTLIGMREGTFHPPSILDQDVSADFLSKKSKKIKGEN